MKILIALSIIMMISGCGKSITEYTAVEISQKVVAEKDPYSSIQKYVGMSVGGYEYMVGSTYYKVRSFKTGDLPITHQIYVTIEYGDDWQYFNSANFLGGEPLEIDVISRDVLYCNSYGCNFKEIIGIDVPDERFRKFATTGMNIKLYAKSGHTRVINVTPNYIQGHLTAIALY